MNWYEIGAICAFVGTIFFGVSVVLKYSKKKKLDEVKQKELKKLLKNINSIYNNPKQKIIDYDKLYHKILQELGYEGTFGEILKKEPNEVGDLDKVWELHKLRNKLVHEFDLITNATLNKKANEYEREIKVFLK
ncbi:hypothetical protein KGV55_02170 [Candidatus Gracilibacteria bacterium]|nr:hypothetical protein [Candidatus Gracilibacteria bacterium]